ncbi:TPA: carbohydrate porin [Pseudomonas putida]|uniref:carbohydrate porin n=1 Tax=Pseudomonas putida TaxID=303 RepID=UPI002363CAA8|nr:carbohydrate porin [Pseudomonas putida]MDD2076534.1 carbohydrate porin [Pseudomonas putida]HDS1692428.1 carbohydrate porin [Pseudomonas putida]
MSTFKLRALLVAMACAQTTAQAAEPFASDSPWAFGDWDGTRNRLAQQGIDFEFSYVGEIGANLSGGYNKDHSASYSDQYSLGALFDLQKLFGLRDASFQLTVTDRNGDNISNDRIGDPRVGTLSSSQSVWGRGSHWRLTQLYYQQAFLGRRLNIKAGRFGEGEDFNSFDCNFQNLTFCGSQVGNWGGIWYNWPVSQWALRVKYALSPELYAQVGAYEQNPSNTESRNGFKLSGSGAQGAVLPVELVWQPRIDGLPGEYRAGYYYSSANAQDVLKDSRGQPAVLSGAAYRSASSKHGLWLGAMQQVTRETGDEVRGLTLFAMATLHDKKTSKVDHYVSVGAVYKGLFAMRPKDDIGLALSKVHVNPAYTKNTALINLANGESDYDSPSYLPVQESEYNVELNYGVHVTDWLTMRPNLQFVRHPGGVKMVDDAWVGGIKIQASF